MYAISFSALTLLASVCTSTLATTLKARDATSNVNMFSGNICNGASSSFSVFGSGSYRCVPVSQDRRSISVTGDGCKTVTWSGTNCQGDSFVIPDSACHSVLYGSVSVQC